LESGIEFKKLESPSELFCANPLLADRIQICISIKYVAESSSYFDLLPYCYAVLGEYLQSKKEFKIIFSSSNHQYYIEVPDDLYKEKYPYFSHLRLNMNSPFTLTVEFNFTRLIRSYAKDYKGFDSELDSMIRIAENNYVNRRIWHDWDSYLIERLVEDVYSICCSFANFIMGEYIEDFPFDYCQVTVKQIEFNKDFYVGRNRSAVVLKELQNFIMSASGVEWISALGGYAISYYESDGKITESARFYGDLHTPTLKIPISKGIFFKIYRKTTDDIRFEVTFKKRFILRNCKKSAFDFAYPILRACAKDFIRKAKFNDILKSAVDNSYPDRFSILERLYTFFDLTYPEFSIVLDCIMHGDPITNPKDIKIIRSNGRISHLFSSALLPNGRPVLTYNLNKPKRKVNEKAESNFMVGVYKNYKECYPNEHIALSQDGKCLIHKR
jgi:hypothetical protein